MRLIARQDNLAAMRELGDATVQLVYMDPPFNTRRAFGLQVSERDGAGRDGLRASFTDALNWTEESERDLAELKRCLPRRSSELIAGLCTSLPKPIGAYLVMMGSRLAHIRRLLSEDGSVFVHCDPTASHYLKIVLDAIFGADNFRNEIIWRRTHAHGSARRFAPVHDTILFYSRTKSYVWTNPRLPYSEEYVEKFFRHEDDRGRYQLITCTGPGDRTGTRAHYCWRGVWPPAGRHWAWTADEMERLDRLGLIVHSATGVPRRKHYVDEGGGVAIADVWDDIVRLDSHSGERVGFETQKPLSLLTRLIDAASEPGATVLDPFGGSGTTAVACESRSRNWVLIDSSLAACSLALGRLRKQWDRIPVRLEGFPASIEGALGLRDRDPDTFGLWGTSILGTLLDRRSSLDTVAVGHRGGDRAPDRVTSWVPLTRAADVSSLLRTHAASAHRVLVTGDSEATATDGRDPSVVPVHLSVCVSDAVRASGFVGSALA